MKRSDRRGGPISPQVPLWAALLKTLRSPGRLLVLWNWKSALLSLSLRGPIFLIATVHRGWRSSVAALLTESVFCVLTAGFYGALVQTLRNAQPPWLTLTFLTLIVPGAFQVFEYWLHRSRGTPHLWRAEAASIAVSGISALFNWYAMRRGALLVGSEGGALGADLRRLPRLIFGFLAMPPRELVARMKRKQPDFAGRSGKGK